MKTLVRILTATGAATLLALTAHAQVADPFQRHLDAAKNAAGADHTALYTRICTQSEEMSRPRVQAAGGGGGGGSQQTPPARATWHAEPVKVFDNLYYVGMTEYSAWAITTSAGIILLDAIYDYSVEDEVVDGLRKLGLDPADLKYAIVSHAHTDHIGGAKLLQDRFGTRIVMTREDWDVSDRTIRAAIRPRRDVEVKDRDTLTLGDTTVTLYHTPGHTPGTLSTIFQVTDGPRRHTVATWGGTAFNFQPRPENFVPYILSAQRFRDVITWAGADVLLSNHTMYDGSTTKLPALAVRKPGERHPYVIGGDAIRRYLTVAEECAMAGFIGTSRLGASNE